jgi:hypothetical protein
MQGNLEAQIRHIPIKNTRTVHYMMMFSAACYVFKTKHTLVRKLQILIVRNVNETDNWAIYGLRTEGIISLHAKN